MRIVSAFALLFTAKGSDVSDMHVYQAAKAASDEAGIMHPRADHPVPPVNAIDIASRHQIRQSRKKRDTPLPNAYSADCPLVFDVAFVQDVTHSYLDNIGQIQDQFLDIIDDFQAAYPEAIFSLSSFKDKPHARLGWDNDFCYFLFQGFTDDAEALGGAFESLVPWVGGGYDWPENQLEAMLHVALSPTIGWRNKEDSFPGGAKLVKLMIVVTDSIYHIAGDAALENLPGVVPNDHDEILDCMGEDYPDITKLGEIFLDHDIIPAFIVADHPLVEAVNLVEVYNELILKMFGDTSRGHVQTLDSNAEGFRAAVEAIAQAIVKDECGICTDNELKEDMIIRDLSDSTRNDIAAYDQYVTDKFLAVPNLVLSLFSNTDKPVQPFGYSVSMDFCYWQHTDWLAFEDFLPEYKLTDTQHRSGGDFWENQLDAAIQAVQSVTWNARAECRCIHLLTDAAPHLAGDFADGTPYDLFTPNCEGSDYPSMDQFGDVLQKASVSCVVVVTSRQAEDFWLEVQSYLVENYGISMSIEIVAEEAVLPARLLDEVDASAAKSSIGNRKTHRSQADLLRMSSPGYQMPHRRI